MDTNNSEAIQQLNEKLNAKQISVKEFRTELRTILQAFSDKDILALYSLGAGHVMVYKGHGIKPMHHIRVGFSETHKECMRRMSPKK